MLFVCRILRLMDNHGSRNLSRREFLHGLKEVGLELSEDETKEVFHRFDTNGDGSVNIDEFLLSIRVSNITIVTSNISLGAIITCLRHLLF